MLWEAAAEYQRNYPLWMEGPFSDLNAEQVEKSCNETFRTVYKLMTKGFKDMPEPLQVATAVKQKVTTFLSWMCELTTYS